MGTPAELHLLDPGLHVQTHDEPLTRATHLAAELGADLCQTTQQAEALLAELQALPPLSADAIELLRGLTERVAAAQRIMNSTLDRAALEVGERLGANGTGVAIHPSAVRDRAAAVVAAGDSLHVAEEDLRAAEAPARRVDVPELPPPPAPSHVASFEDERPAPRRRRFLGLGRRRASRRRHDEDTSESTSLLQQVAATTDEAFGARRALLARDDQVVLLRALRDRAQEELRVTERAWRDLAGDDDVEDVELVVRRVDPQHQDALAVAQETVGVRAASTLLHRALERWEEGWHSVEVEPPATPDLAAMDEIAERLARPVVLVADAVDQAALVALAAPAAVVLAVEPSSAS